MTLQKLLLSFIFILFFQLKVDAQATAKKQNLDIVFIGNSITEGVALNDPKKESPPTTASDYLSKQLGVGEIRFNNEGRSGKTTVDFLPSTETAFSEVITATQKLHKDNNRLLIFSISLGTNDSAEYGPNGAPVSAADYRKNLKSITDQLLITFPTCKIIFQQPVWYSPNTHNTSRYMAEGLSRLQTYFPELTSLVVEYSQTNKGHVFMGDQKGFIYFKDNHLTELVSEPGAKGDFYLHPNKKGSVTLGELWGKAIYQEILKK